MIFLQVIPSALLALTVHPYTHHFRLNRMLWAFCVYLESVSVLPQLRLMQNAKVRILYKLLVLTITVHYDTNKIVVTFVHLQHTTYLQHATFWFTWFQMVEPFTAHYVFALGVARFIGCAHWILQVVWKCLVMLLNIVHLIYVEPSDLDLESTQCQTSYLTSAVWLCYPVCHSLTWHNVWWSNNCAF